MYRHLEQVRGWGSTGPTSSVLKQAMYGTYVTYHGCRLEPECCRNLGYNIYMKKVNIYNTVCFFGLRFWFIIWRGSAAMTMAKAENNSEGGGQRHNNNKSSKINIFLKNFYEIC